MVDGILANPRNPANHDLWLTGRFSTSRQPSLFLSLYLEWGTFLPLNKSMSNTITGWGLVDPASGEILCLFHFQESFKSQTYLQNTRDVLFTGCRLCRRPLRFDDWMIRWLLIGNGGFGLEMVGLVHPQSGLLCGAALPEAFFSRKT